MAYALAFLIGVAVGALSVYWFVLRHKLEDYRRIEQSREQWKELAERQNQLLDALSIVNAAAKEKGHGMKKSISQLWYALLLIPPPPAQVPFAEHIDSPAEMFSGAIMLGGCVVAIVVLFGIILAVAGEKRWSAAALLLALPLGAICASSSFIIMMSGG